MTCDLTQVLARGGVVGYMSLAEFGSVILRNMPKTSIEALLDAAAYLDRCETG